MKTHKSETNSILGPVHTKLEVFRKGRFHSENASVHTTLEEFKNAEIPVILSYFRFVFKENSGQGNHMIIF